MITNSPNLKELTISGSSLATSDYTATTSAATSDLEFWEKQCPWGCTLGQLKSIRMSELSCLPHEMEFIKFLLRNSPGLETMHVSPSSYVKENVIHMLVELVRFRRASAQAELIFEHE
ncbi:hypothetical protein SAY87_013899 [Trapa incisa]|uniref:FBD domain-containing protein n=1 Tax=Trapa incisa TaxID=236973 RepID=A0AAN7QDJ2_9MYRT|nr:hypothetical protein SAY87_013899 [Trapa incisa]